MRRLWTILLSLLLALSPLTGCAGAADSAPTTVMYEIFVASFQDSDGDGCGDLRGVMDRLDYLQSLGVSHLWLMPIHPSPSYHKYDVTDYYAVDPDYGTLEDFDALAAACHERGMRLVMDLVFNHSSSAHPWFLAACDDQLFHRDGKTADWYVFSDAPANNFHKVSGCAAYYEGQFGSHMPDFNLNSESLRAEMANIIRFWQGHGADGFRLDAVTSYYVGAAESTVDFLRFLCETARQNDPDCYLVGEAWTNDVTILNLYQSGIDSLFNFPASDSTGLLVKAALSGKGAAVATALSTWNERVKAASPRSVDAPFLSNHDQARARGMLRSKVPNEKAAAMLYLLLPGLPVVYYGEELGMSGSGRDENKRLPMVWSADASTWCDAPADADQPQRLKEGAAEQDTDADSLLNCYRALIALRAQAPELLHGQMTALDGGDSAICFFRVDEGAHAVAVAVNVSQSATLTVPLTAVEGATLSGSYGEGVSLTAEGLLLPPLSCALLRVK